MAESNDTNENSDEPEFLGYLARFEDPHALVDGCDAARRAGYKKMDAFSPFPVHGIDDAIGIKRTRLPVAVFCVGLCAVGIAVFLQFYTNAFHHNGLFPGYDFKISGKAAFSFPANIPVVFEICVLLCAFTTFFGMWILNGLPKLSNPLFRNQDFRRATSDGFFLFIENKDGAFDETNTRNELQQWGAVSVEAVDDPNEQLQVPGYFKMSGLIIAALMLVPPVVIYRAQFTKNPLPRMHVNPDMDRQFRGESQDASPKVGGKPLFDDNRVMRIDPVGTIARGELGRLTDSEFYAGVKKGSEIKPKLALAGFHGSTQEKSSANPATEKVEPEPDWIDVFPSQVLAKLESEESGREFYERGKQRFDVYCSVCHGYAGFGDGHVSKKGMALNLAQKASWVKAKSLYDPKVMEQPVGRIFDTITNGRSAMGPYRSQITAEDRWAIVFFVKALQLSRNGEKGDVPEDALLQAWVQVDPGDVAEADDAKAKDKSKVESGDDGGNGVANGGPGGSAGKNEKKKADSP